MNHSVPHDVAMAELYRRDPTFAAFMLDEALKEGNQIDVLRTMRQIADAKGGVGMMSEGTSLGRTSLYKSLSEKGNPVLSTLMELLKSMGLRLSVQPLQPPLQVA